MQVAQQDNGRTSAELTLMLYGWQGESTTFTHLKHCLPHRSAARITMVDKSARLVSRAATYLTPRTAGGSGMSRAGSISRPSVSVAGSFMYDDGASTASMPIPAGRANTPPHPASAYRRHHMQ